MSDIAPFASACCRNVVEGLKEENEDIKKKNEQLHKQLVKRKKHHLENPIDRDHRAGRIPVYATGDL
jgi:hypothetical protein